MFGNKTDKQAKLNAQADKVEEVANRQHSEEVKALLLPNEEVIKIHGLLADYAVITTDRLIFVDANYAVVNKKRRIVSIFFHHIHEVAFDYNDIALNDVKVTTSHHDYELKMGNRELAKRFAIELMEQMRK